MGLGKLTIFTFFALVLVLNDSIMASSPDSRDKSELILDHTNLLDLDKEQESFKHFVQHLAQRKGRYKKEESFIRYVFHKTHNKYLKHYVEQASIDELFNNGDYDCLTGTALYLMIFEQLGYRYQVTELDYHVFMTLTSVDKSYTIESTDPMNGIVVSSSSVEAELKDTYNSSISNKISVEQLIGLLYFNQAVKSYNDFNFDMAWKSLQTAKEHYPSDRINEFELLILKEISRNEIALVN